MKSSPCHQGVWEHPCLSCVFMLTGNDGISTVVTSPTTYSGSTRFESWLLWQVVASFSSVPSVYASACLQGVWGRGCTYTFLALLYMNWADTFIRKLGGYLTIGYERFFKHSIQFFVRSHSKTLYNATVQEVRVTGVFRPCPSSGILKARKHNVSETGSVSILRWGGRHLFCWFP
jgi:hypothetical protein